VAEDTSRLWRSLQEQWRAVSEPMDGGVLIVTQDIDTQAENFKILLSVHGAMADVYRDQMAYRTRRGLRYRLRPSPGASCNRSRRRLGIGVGGFNSAFRPAARGMKC
jgi:Resolvase, N terminal domain